MTALGDHVENAKNCYQVFDITEGLEDAKYVHWGGLQARDIYDGGPGIGDVAELLYEVVDTGLHSSDIAFANVVYGSQRVRYALYCHGSKDLFGCIGLRSKQYCILNKQYSREEYEALVPKIKEHMDEVPYISKRKSEARSTKSETNSNAENTKFQTREITYKYGEFFPEAIAPYAFNASIAGDYVRLNSREAEQLGYGWRAAGEHAHTPTVNASELPERIGDVADAIEREIIACAHAGTCDHGCTKAFRIIPQELAFYRTLNVPVPDQCFNCRHAARLAQRNPMKLWHRACQCAGRQSAERESQSANRQALSDTRVGLSAKRQTLSDTRPALSSVYPNTAQHFHGESHCPNEFETSYAPERPEIVYCEQCYQAEVV